MKNLGRVRPVMGRNCNIRIEQENYTVDEEKEISGKSKDRICSDEGGKMGTVRGREYRRGRSYKKMDLRDGGMVGQDCTRTKRWPGKAYDAWEECRVQKAKMEKKKLFVASVDLKAAFDSVDGRKSWKIIE
ncbi:hypothetical protein QAD02_007338 [Eretmocerus hayati]|uniref:Uncharacterized protein n=1 Tax=Eretmocerus hayati TaxID=131215 RepID=A0ACC2N3P2_9HYME|nr:hypothetical protein QAD02_007338 [Eretmocerus hayati]